MRQLWSALLLMVMMVAVAARAAGTTEPPPTAESVAAEKSDRAAKKEAKAAKAQAKREAKIEEALAENKDVVTFYTNNRMDYVKLETITKKEAEKHGAQHPAIIPVDQMKQYLGAILVSEKDLLKKNPEITQVFNDKATDFLAPILVKAFSRARPDQVVVFSWLTKDPLIVIRNDRIVVGECWIKDNLLHIQFNKLLAKLVGDYDKRGNFNLVVDRAKGLRIKLLASAVVTPGGRHGTEAVIAMGGDFSALATPDSVVGGGDVKKASAQRSVKDRLTDLDQLRKDKMVTEAEYQAKRKAILDNM